MSQGGVGLIGVALVIGIHIGDRARHLADEPSANPDAITRSVLGVGVRSCHTAGNSSAEGE
jgi:F0F1-type ATP synthase membrane subunit c/vacuolar-type H+-ATPase subunit K